MLSVVTHCSGRKIGAQSLRYAHPGFGLGGPGCLPRPHDCVCVHLPPPLTKSPPFRVASGVSERRPPAACPSVSLSVPSLSSCPLPLAGSASVSVSPCHLCCPLGCLHCSTSACLSLSHPLPFSSSLSLPAVCLSLSLSDSLPLLFTSYSSVSLLFASFLSTFQVQVTLSPSDELPDFSAPS